MWYVELVNFRPSFMQKSKKKVSHFCKYHIQNGDLKKERREKRSRKTSAGGCAQLHDRSGALNWWVPPFLCQCTQFHVNSFTKVFIHTFISSSSQNKTLLTVLPSYLVPSACRLTWGLSQLCFHYIFYFFHTKNYQQKDPLQNHRINKLDSG